MGLEFSKSVPTAAAFAPSPADPAPESPRDLGPLTDGFPRSFPKQTLSPRLPLDHWRGGGHSRRVAHGLAGGHPDEILAPQAWLPPTGFSRQHTAWSPMTGLSMTPTTFPFSWGTTGTGEFVRTPEMRSDGSFIHPDYYYKGAGFRNDAALVEILEPAPATPVRVLTPEQEAWYAPSGTKGTAVGWGRTDDGGYPRILRQVGVPVWSPEDCLRDTLWRNREIVHDRTLCAGSEGMGIDSRRQRRPSPGGSPRWRLGAGGNPFSGATCASRIPGRLHPDLRHL